MSDRPNALPWYRKPDARYGPTNFLLDAAAKFVGQPLYDAYKGIGQAAGFEQDPNAPRGYVSHDALNRAANGIAAGQVMGSGFARAPAGALRSGAAGSELDMSQAARMQRARDMGFDPDTVWYHGTSRDFDSFDPSKGGELGHGVYLTPHAEHAIEYTRPNYGGGFPDGARVLPVYAKKMKPLEREEWLNLRSKYMDELRAENAGEWKSKFVSEAERRISDGIQAEGYSGFYTPNKIGEPSLMMDQAVVFDPSNIRSVNAAFDPAKSSSSNLMAADPFAGAMVPTYPQPQRKNQLPMTF